METDLSGDVVETDHVDDADLLWLVEDAELQFREADRRKLRYALEWARRHTVSDARDAAHWSDADLRDLEQAIGGEGTPLVASACVASFATARGVGTRTAMPLLSDALDLCYRLPRVWAQVEAVQVAPWRARKIAAATHGLSHKAAAQVDAQVAGIADSCGPARLERLVAQAVAKFDPVEQAEVEDQAKALWGVRLDDYQGLRWAETSRIEIIGDTPTLHRFKDGRRVELADLRDQHRGADQHDPPAWMRDLVILRDRTCVFAYCSTDSRDCDLDHLEAFVEMDDGGPPGQTRPDNLAPLCRGHHRAKTHHGWTYTRNSDGSYTWTNPHGRRFTVDRAGVVVRG